MVYDNSTVRRQDRLLDEEKALELLQTAEYGTLSMIDEDGLPYGIPVNYIWDEKDSLYIHCAPEGKKLRAIAAHLLAGRPDVQCNADQEGTQSPGPLQCAGVLLQPLRHHRRLRCEAHLCGNQDSIRPGEVYQDPAAASFQTLIEETAEYSIYQFYVVPTFDFKQEILSHGPDYEVLAPEWYREEIREDIQNMLKNYVL